VTTTKPTPRPVTPTLAPSNESSGDTPTSNTPIRNSDRPTTNTFTSVRRIVTPKIPGQPGDESPAPVTQPSIVTEQPANTAPPPRLTTQAADRATSNKLAIETPSNVSVAPAAASTTSDYSPLIYTARAAATLTSTSNAATRETATSFVSEVPVAAAPAVAAAAAGASTFSGPAEIQAVAGGVVHVAEMAILAEPLLLLTPEEVGELYAADAPSAGLAIAAPFDLAALDGALNDLLHTLADARQALDETVGGVGVAPWLALLAAAVTTYEIARRRRGQAERAALSAALPQEPS
jgi:hypothetical protein